MTCLQLKVDAQFHFNTCPKSLNKYILKCHYIYKDWMVMAFFGTSKHQSHTGIYILTGIYAIRVISIPLPKQGNKKITTCWIKTIYLI